MPNGKGPRAELRPKSIDLHGVTIDDPYAWLRDENWREVMRDPGLLDPSVRAHLEAENDFAEQALGHLSGLRKQLVEEMRGRIKEDDSSVPAADGPFTYFHDYEAGAQHPRYCRRPII